MKVTPVKDVEKPKYPLKEEMPAETLKGAVPKRWLSSPAAKVALGTLAVVTLTGCTATGQTAGVPTPPTTQTEGTQSWGQTECPTVTFSQTAGVPEPSATPIIDGTMMGEALTPMIAIAPLFVHGQGTGAFGCEMVAPPAFLSEAEALIVINEVAEEYGLSFSDKETPVFSGVLLPSVNIADPNDMEPASETASLKADFADMDHGIALSFVSVEDIKSWNQGPQSAIVEQYETKDAAEQLSEALENAWSDDGLGYTAGVFYDPCAFSDQSEAQSRELSEEQLKEQVRDFCNWLKDMGIV